MVEVMKIKATSFKGPMHALLCMLSVPDSEAGHHQPMPLSETPGRSRASLGRLLWGHCSFLLSPVAHKVLFVLSQETVSPVLCKFWQPYGGVNGNLL